MPKTKTNYMFEETALQLFQTQYLRCTPYKQWCDALGIRPEEVKTTRDIPFLPIEFFRTHRIYSDNTTPQLTFASSGTTSEQTSHHYVARAENYIQAFTRGFEEFYGNPGQYSFFALLPGYLERQNSSLAYMVQHLQAQNPTHGGFFLNNLPQFHKQLLRAIENNERIFIIGVTFAMVDYANQYKIALPPDAIVMETGGMKGRHREISRHELHTLLKNSFSTDNIHSEYGMTELLSQAYAAAGTRFRPTSTMRVVGRSLTNPLEILSPADQLVGLNIIDLANTDSCCFIATGDCGRVFEDGSFEVQGRIEGHILRGCNMLA